MILWHDHGDYGKALGVLIFSQVCSFGVLEVSTILYFITMMESHIAFLRVKENISDMQDTLSVEIESHINLRRRMLKV
jgi:hypothetical protein